MGYGLGLALAGGMGDLVPLAVQVVLKLAEADTLAAGEVGTAWARLLVGVFDADM
jgi:hypothetical protein